MSVKIYVETVVQTFGPSQVSESIAISQLTIDFDSIAQANVAYDELVSTSSPKQGIRTVVKLY